MAEMLNHATSVRRPTRARRIGVRMDMTPMVDVAFLLLTFFMLTAVFSQPLAMEMSLPPADAPFVPVPESNVLTLRAGADGAVWWSVGGAAPLRTESVAAVLRDHAHRTPETITLLRISPAGRYGAAVDLLDELAEAGVRRFAFARFTDADRQLIAGPGATTRPAAFPR